jgi:hypothetical protein
LEKREVAARIPGAGLAKSAIFVTPCRLSSRKVGAIKPFAKMPTRPRPREIDCLWHRREHDRPKLHGHEPNPLKYRRLRRVKHKETLSSAQRFSSPARRIPAVEQVIEDVRRVLRPNDRHQGDPPAGAGEKSGPRGRNQRRRPIKSQDKPRILDVVDNDRGSEPNHA